jgi:hypothetical protein
LIINDKYNNDTTNDTLFIGTTSSTNDYNNIDNDDYYYSDDNQLRKKAKSANFSLKVNNSKTIGSENVVIKVKCYMKMYLKEGKITIKL